MEVLDPFAMPLDGLQLVEASAGTGKTFTITTLLLRLVVERRLAVNTILVVTYTNAATDELRDRVRKRLRQALEFVDGRAEPANSDHGPDPMFAWLRARSAERVSDRVLLVDAVRAMDEASIFTIHGFCQRALSENAFESGVRFDMELLTDQAELVEEVVEDFWARTAYRATEAALRALSRAKVNPDSLRRLALKVVADRDMPVVPPAPAASSAIDVDAALAPVVRSYRALAESWARDGAAVRELILRGSLSRVMYKPDTLPAKLADVDEWLGRAATGGDPVPPASLVLLTPAKLRAGTTKQSGKTTPSHPFFDACCEHLALVEAARATGDAFALAVQHELVSFARTQLAARKEAAGQLAFDDLLWRLGQALDDPRRSEATPPVDPARASRGRKTRAQLSFDALGSAAESAAAEAAAGGARRGETRGEVLAGRLHARYPVALIDEFQDTDPVQYRVFRAIYRGRSGALFLVGDPKQAIYGFRGADIHAYLAAAEDAGEARRTLGVNRRSDEDLVRATNRLFLAARAPFLFDEIRFHDVTPRPGAVARLTFPDGARPPLELRFIPRDGKVGARDPGIRKSWGHEQLPVEVASDVARLLASGARIDDAAIHAGQLAVLVATHAQGRAMQRALQALRIPSVLHGDANVLRSAEATDLLRALHAVADPSDAAAVRTALSTSLFGWSADEILALRDHDAANPGSSPSAIASGSRSGETRWQEVVDRFADWNERWRTRGFMAAFRRLLLDEAMAARLLSLADGERRLTNLLHLAELLQHEAASRHLGVAGLLQWYEQIARDPGEYEGPAQDAAQIRLESDDEAVQIITMHRAKGLEYPVVFCPFLWDGALLRGDDRQFLKFPDDEDGGRRKLEIVLDADDPTTARHVATAERDALAEKLRLLYVAVTRARHRCVIYWGGFNEGESSPLAYLLHQGPASARTLDPASTLHLASTGDLANGADPRPPWLVVRERFAELDDAALVREIEQLARSSNGTIAVESLRAGEPSPPYRRPPLDAARFAARGFRRTLDDAWRTTSFSGLTANAAPAAAGELATVEGLDHDGGRGGARPGEEPVTTTGGAPVRLAEFERGARAGSTLHEILERVDFAERDPAVLRAVAGERLGHHGLDATRWTDPVCAALRDVLAAPLPALDGGAPFALRDVARARRIVEMGFFLPVAGGMESDGSSHLLASALANAFRRHAATPLVAAYADRVAPLRFVPVEGFLRGFIDLVFEHRGRFYVADYKSNHLGARREDYAPALLEPPMAEHHYLLQYHLYCVAVHRLLERRVPDYDYDRHFGGVYYLFLRGMAPGALADPSSSAYPGVFTDRPPRALIEALAAEIAAPPRSRR